MQVVNALIDNIKVINRRKELAKGTPEEIQKSPKLIDAYLGNSKIVEEAEAPFKPIEIASQSRKPE